MAADPDPRSEPGPTGDVGDRDRRVVPDAAMPGPAASALTVVAVILGVWSVRAIEAFLVPLVFALLLLALVNALDRMWRRVRIGGRTLPPLLATVLSTVVIVSGLAFAVDMLVSNASALASAAPRYQTRYDDLVAQLSGHVGMEIPDLLQEMSDRVDVAALIRQVASGLAGVIGTTALVLVYLFFLLLERRTFAGRLQSMVPDEARRRELGRILTRIDHDVSAYLGLKTLVSLMTAIPSWAIMKYVGLDFAEFWAALILALNFIPNVGSLVATAMPSLLALLQFDTLRPFFVVAIGVTAIQLVVANFIEPPVMGKRLNMSPLVVIVSLVAWSMLWGLPGAFLCVPMTAMLILILGNIPRTRWLAALLSADGRVGPDPPEPSASPRRRGGRAAAGSAAP